MVDTDRKTMVSAVTSHYVINRKKNVEKNMGLTKERIKIFLGLIPLRTVEGDDTKGGETDIISSTRSRDKIKNVTYKQRIN